MNMFTMTEQKWWIVLTLLTSVTKAKPLQEDFNEVCTAEPYFSDCKDVEYVNNPDWMSKLPDETSISSLSIPGTHDTMAHYGTAIAICHQWRLGTQYQAGVRFLDIRLRHVGLNLNIHHGVAYQFANFYDMLNISRDFLQEHPSEVVLVRIKQEHTPSNPVGLFYERVQDHIDQYPGLVWTTTEMPSLGDARGKLVLLQNFDGPPMFIDYSSLSIADEWVVPDLREESISAKWESVENNLYRALKNEDERTYLTYSSGASIRALPNAVALRINPTLLDFLQDIDHGRLGMIAMDFPGEEIVQRIVDSNFA